MLNYVVTEYDYLMSKNSVQRALEIEIGYHYFTDMHTYGPLPRVEMDCMLRSYL